MNKKLVMWGTFLIVFFLSIVGSYKFINRNNQDMTIELSAPTLPLITVVLEGEHYNTLRGYTGNTDVSDVAKYVCPVSEDRIFKGSVETFGTDVTGVSYEVRNNDGSRLIESGSISWEEKTSNVLEFQVKMKDLIVVGEEYIFAVILNTDQHDKVYYYTRFLYGNSYDLDNQLQFVRQFHESTLEKDRVSEIAPYMETDKSQDNSTLAFVNIHSTTSQVVWDDLPVTLVSEPDIYITYLQDNFGGYTLDYYVSSDVNGVFEQYHVVENFLVSTYGEEIYLLDYERTADRIFDDTDEVYQNDKINLSIQSKEIPVVESEDGNMAAFVVNSSLYYYDDLENKIYHVYGFFDGVTDDERSMYWSHDIKVLQVAESGSMHFIVYGYMNRGSYEGRTGIALYYYNGQTKLVEEIGFCESTRSPEYVMQEISKLAYMSRQEKFYFCMEGNILCYDLANGTTEVKIGYQQQQKVFVSEDHSCVVVEDAEGVQFLQLESGTSQWITTEANEEIVPHGFIDNDFVYGISGEDDWVLQSDGSYARYMKEVCIQSAQGEIKKKYRDEEALISRCTIAGNQILLDKVWVQNGKVVSAPQEQIVSSKSEERRYNTITPALTDTYQTIQQVELKNKIDIGTLECVKTKEVFYEQRKSIGTVLQQVPAYYSVYSPWHVVDYVTDAGDAVRLADELEGYTRDADGAFVWKKAATLVKNQIMAIELEAVTSERDSKTICLDIMLKQVGSPKDSQAELQVGKTCQEILDIAQEDYILMDITGSSLEAMLYYTNQDIPIMVLYDSGEAILITGFNQFNIVVMDPLNKKLGYMSRSDAKEMLEETENQVFTYYRRKIN